MRKKLLGLFAALGMSVTGVAVSVAPTEAVAQSHRGDRGPDRFHRGPDVRRGDFRPGPRGYRGDRRGFRHDRHGYDRRNDRRFRHDRGRHYGYRR